jgi:hypothetical protein
MIIGVSGKKRSGKDTFYTVAKKLLEGRYPVRRYAFADNVKKFAVQYLNIPAADIKNEEYRYILQGIGQMLRDEVSKEFWVHSLFTEISNSRRINPSEISVITDVRYQNEVEAILSRDNSIVIKVENPNTFSIDYHLSERDLDDFEFDFVIKNDGSISEYEEKIEAWLKQNLPWIIHW